MKLVIGLGNPEAKFLNTRHNVGFSILNTYAKKQGVQFQDKAKFRAMIAEFSKDGEKVILAKPTTYYNNVGEAGRLLADFYKIDPSDILIIHDELALWLGVIRTRIG